MGFWGGLGKVLSVAAPIVAAPFTGGTSLLGLAGAGAGTAAAIGTGLGAAGSALGAFSQGQAQNRGQQFGGQMDLEHLLMQRDQQQFNNTLAREQDGRQGASDAWRKLLASQRVLSPGAKPQLAGQYNVAPRQATGMERQGAEALSAEVMQRLMGGNPIAAPTQRPMSVDPKLLQSGALEKILGGASPFLSFLGKMPARPTGSNYPDMAGTHGFGG